jgi:hypothetical protein
MPSKALHPQNSRVGDDGLPFPPDVPNRRPPVYVTEHGEEKHETPLCPAVRGRTHYMVCREEVLYALGERWCETCRQYDIDLERRDTGWTDPRYKRGDERDA